MKKFSVAGLLLILLLPLSSRGQVVLNELMVRPAGTTSSPPNGLIYVNSLEYIELYNSGCTPIDVGGYYLGMRQDFSGIVSGGSFRIPNVAAAVIQPKKHIVLASASPGAGLSLADIDIPMSLANSCVYNGNFVLPNVDGWCALYNPSGVPVDAIYWTSAAGNLTTQPLDFSGTLCIPTGGSASTLPNAQQINTGYPGILQYVGASFTTGGTPVSRSPDGGGWVRNLPSSISKTAPTGNCNNASCYVPTPAVTGFTYTTPVCATGTLNPSLSAGFSTGGTFTSTPAGLSINASTGVINLGSSTPGTYTVTYTITGSVCFAPGNSSFNITVNASGTPVTGFSYTTPVCANAANQTPTLATGFTTGGTFSSTAGLSLNASTGVINVAASTPGTYTVTYSIAASGCQSAGTNTANITISNNITPTTGFSYTSPVCANAANQTPTLATGFTTGGTFSSTTGLSLNASTGVIDVATSTPGTYTVTYSVSASGCQLAGSNTASITINANTNPTTGFSYTSPVCANAANQTPTLATGFTTGGTFSSTTGLSLNASTGVINVAASTPGTYTVTYSVSASGCQLAGTNTASITINANTNPTTGFSYTSPVCANAANQTPTLATGFTTGGTFSSTAGLSLNASTGVIDVTASTPGTYTVTYSVSASGCQLAGSNTFSFTISSSINPVTGFSYTSPVCANAANQTPTLATGFTTGGTFSSTAGLSLNASTGVIDVAASTPGTYTITYSVSASGCLLAGTNTANITINPTTAPVTGFSYTTPVCNNAANQSPTLATGFTTGGTYSSTAGLSLNASTGLINVAASTPGTYTITYAVSATGCQAAASNTASITINANTNPTLGFSYTSPVCANAANQNPNTVAGFTTGGTYSSTAGLSINASTGVINVAASTPGNYTVTYSVSASGCQLAGNNTASITINATTNPTLGFSYTSPVCANAANQNPNTVAGFTTGGTYSSTAGLSLNASTGVINVAASTPGTYTVTYSVSASGCQLAGNNTASITINPTTNPVTGFSYTSPVCANAANQNPNTVAGFTTGGTYSSTAGLSINASTGVINVAASTPGTYTITYAVSATGCQLAASNTASITINATTTPTLGFSYTSPVCANASNQNPNPVAGFTTGGTYSSTAGLNINASTGVIDVAASTPGTYTVTYSVSASGCLLAGSNTTTITINPTTAPTTGFSYTSPVCNNAANLTPIPTAGFTTGGSYSSTVGLSLNATTGVIDVSASAPGSYTITYSVAATGCAQAGSGTTNLIIRAVPPAPVVNPTRSYCLNDATVPLTALGVNLLWYTTATGGTGSAAAPFPTTATAGTTTYYVSQTLNGCESPRAAIVATVHPLPVVSAGPDRQILTGQSVALNGSATGTGLTLVWTPNTNIDNNTIATPRVSPTTTTTYTLTATSTAGCIGSDAAVVTVLRDIIVPNAFSPNGDGSNDRWVIKYIEDYPNSVVEIFNRYGQSLYLQKGYSSTNAWDGQQQGKPLPVGVYYYIINLNDGRKPFSGSISIIR